MPASPSGGRRPFIGLIQLNVSHSCTRHTDTVRTSQEAHYISSTETNRLMAFGETVAVYCKMCGQNAEFYYVEAGGT
jgi:hypothetical protein